MYNLGDSGQFVWSQPAIFDRTCEESGCDATAVLLSSMVCSNLQALPHSSRLSKWIERSFPAIDCRLVVLAAPQRYIMILTQIANLPLHTEYQWGTEPCCHIVRSRKRRKLRMFPYRRYALSCSGSWNDSK